MKIRNPFLIKLAGRLGSYGIQGLIRSLRYEWRSLGDEITCPISAIPKGKRYAYSLWHEYMLLPIVRCADPDLAGLISKHADGQILAEFIKSVGMGTVYGSTNRGGIEAVRQIIQRTVHLEHLVVTTDGPRGPRRQVQTGIIYIASRTGMEVVPMGIGYEKCWRAKSWDAFAIPKPGCRAKIILGVPMSIPPKLKADQLEEYRQKVQTEMERLTPLAEEWAMTNRWPINVNPHQADA